MNARKVLLQQLGERCLHGLTPDVIAFCQRVEIIRTKSIGKKGTGIRNIDTRRVAKSLENIIRNEHIKMNSIPADTIGRVSENQLDRTTSRCKNTRSEDSADPLTLNVSLRLI